MQMTTSLTMQTLAWISRGGYLPGDRSEGSLGKLGQSCLLDTTRVEALTDVSGSDLGRM